MPSTFVHIVIIGYVRQNCDKLFPIELLMVIAESIGVLRYDNFIRNVAIINSHTLYNGETGFIQALIEPQNNDDPYLPFRSIKLYRNQTNHKQQYTINLLSYSLSNYNSDEYNTMLQIVDGSILLCNCCSGHMYINKTHLRHSLFQQVKPVAFFDNYDTMFRYDVNNSCSVYQILEKNINRINNHIHDNKPKNFYGDIKLDPVKGNIAFGSVTYQYGFVVNDFVQMYCNKFSLSPDILRKMLWNKFYWKRNRWKRYKYCRIDVNNGFCQFILFPLMTLYKSILKQKESEIYLPIISQLGLNITKKDIAKCKTEHNLLKLVMNTWLPLKNVILNLCVDHLPSPVIAQSYRISKFYSGRLDTFEGQSILSCNKYGPCCMYITKMISFIKYKSNKDRTGIAFGRIFSGTIKKGQKLIVLSSNSTINNKEIRVKGIVMINGENVASCSSGNFCGLMGIKFNSHMTKPFTVTDSLNLEPFHTQNSYQKQ